MSKARDIARAGTALTNVDATELGYLDGVTSAVQTQLDAKAIPANVINNTFVNAKGDIVTATADNTPAILSVGSNGQTLVADSSQSTGLGWAGNAAAGKNAVINGGFDIWQRGTSMSANYAYTADRWQAGRSGGLVSITVSRQATNDTTNLPNIQYCARVQRDSGVTTTYTNYFGQQFETVNSIPFTGKTVTVSFYARAGANFSSTSGTMTATLANGTGTDQNYMIGAYTGANTVVSSVVTLTTTWQRFTMTGTVPTNSTELAIQFSNTPVGTAGANDYFEITGVQLELGSSATPFSRAGGTIQGELAACQRYFQMYNNGANYLSIGTGSYYSTTSVYVTLPTKVTMRTSPTATFSGGATGATVYVAGTARVSTAIASNTLNPDLFQFLITTAADTAGRAADVNVNQNATLTLSAEL